MSFKVPEAQRIRNGELGSDWTYGKNGAFMVPSVVPGRVLVIIASDGSDWKMSGLPGDPWEHVSVHVISGTKEYTPIWEEMCQAKQCFWDAEDTVIQFHPAESNYKNLHPRTLHLWRPTVAEIPMPPIDCV